MFELDDVRVVKRPMDDYLGFQLFFGFALGQALLVDDLRGVSLASFLRDQLEALREAALVVEKSTLPRVRPLMYFLTLLF